MTLDEARGKIRRKVIYSSTPCEFGDVGVITEVRSALVFVRFGDNINSHGCYPEDLVLMRGSSIEEHVLLNQRDAGFPAYGDVDGFRWPERESAR